MSTMIDERVVEMKFDNSLFESGVQTTLGTLDKLKSALKLDGASKGLDAITASARDMNFGPAQAAVDGLSQKFSALEVAGMAVIANIANSLTNKLKNAINSVTLEPIMAGFQEYNTQMNAVQTILANTQSKGSTIEDVNEALNELNTYADKTIYNFTEMTNNIGRFTAAGVNLETSTKSIKGISNLAAVAGSTSHQASTAMYQLSQAISSGALKLQDWNSVVNAGMGGEAFQNALKQTARAMYKLTDEYQKLASQGKSTSEIADELGISLEKAQQIAERPFPDIDVDKAIENAGSFRESLKEGWITADVLTETLGNLTIEYDKVGDAQYNSARQTLLANGYLEDEVDDILQLSKTAADAATKVKTIPQLFDTLKESVQSGWTQTWNYIIGDFEEARELLSGASAMITGIFDGMSNSRNAFWKAFHDDGGRASAIEALTSAFNALMGIISPVNKALSTLFPKVTAEQLNVFCAGLALAAQYLEKLVTEHQDDIRSFTLALIAPLKSVLDFGGRVVKFLGSTVFSAIQVVAGVLLDVGIIVADLVTTFTSAADSVANASKRASNITRLFGGVKQVLKAVGSAVLELINTVRESETFRNFLDFLHKLSEQLGIIAGTAFNTFIKSLASNLYKLAGTIRKFVGNFKTFSSEVIDKIKESEAFKKLAEQLTPLGNNVDKLSTTVTDFAANVKKNVGGIFTAALGIIKNFFGAFVTAPTADTVSGFITKIISVVNWFISIAKGGTAAIRDFFSSFASSVKDSTSSGLLGSVKKLFGSIKDTITGFFASMKKDEKKEGGGQGLLGAIGALFPVNDIASGLSSLLSVVTDTVSVVLGTALGGLSGLIGNVITQFGDALAKIFKGKGIDQILSWLRSGAITYLIGAVGSIFASIGSVGRQAAGILKSVKGVISGFTDIEKSISKTIKAYGSVLKAEAKEKRAEAFLKIAEAVGILAAALFVIGNMDINAILQGAVVIGAMMFLLNKLVDASGGTEVTAAAKGLDAVKDKISGFFDGIKDSLTQAAKLIGLSAVAVGVGITVGLLTIAILKLAELNRNGGLKDAWNAVGMIAALMAIITAALIAISKFAGNGGGLSATLVVIGMAAAINIMSKSIYAFSALKPDQFIQGLGGVIAIILAMTALTAASSGSKLASVGVGMILVAAALNMLMKPLETISSMDETALKTGLVSLGLIVGFLALIGVLASSSIAGAASILIISAAIVLLTPALLALGAAAPIALAGMLSVAAGLVAFALAGLLLAPASIFIVTAAGALLVIAGAMLIAGAAFSLIVVSMTAFAGGLTMLSVSLPLFAKSLIAACNAISESSQAIVNAFLAIISGVSTAIAVGAPMLAMAIATAIIAIVTSGCRVIVACVGPVVDTILTVIQAILEGIASHAQPIVEAILKIIGSIIVALVNSLDGVFEWLRNDGITKIQRIFLSLKLTIATAIKGIFDSIAEMGIPIISGLASDFSDGIDGFISDVESKINDIDLSDAVTDKLNETAESVEEGASTVETATNGLGETLKSGFSSLISPDDGSAQGEGFLSNLTSSLTNGLPDVQSAIGQFTGGGGLFGDFGTMGTEGGDAFTTNLSASITDGMPDVLSQVAGGEEGGLASGLGLMGTEGGDAFTSNLLASLDTGAPSVQASVENLIPLNTEEMSAKAIEHGKCVDDGMAQGVTDNASVVSDATGAMADAALAASAENLGINSPSTKFAEQGRYIDEGLANGIKDNQAKVTTAITTMVTAMLRGVSNQASKFKSEGGKVPTNFAAGISDSLEKAKTAATKMATSAATAAGSKAESFKQAGSDAVTQFVNGLGTQNEEIAKAGSDAGDTFVSGVKGKSSSANGAGSTLASNAVTGAASRNGTTRNPATFYSVGQDAGEGFRLGIISKKKEIVAAATEVANAGLNATANTIQSASPSKKFMKLGEYSSEGFAIGMTNLAGLVAKSSSSVAQTAIDSVTGAVKRFNTLSSRDANLKPVISPVIDTNSAIHNIRGLNKAVTLAQGMATTARISETVEASYTVNHDQAEMQAMLRGMYACMMEYFPQFADNKYAVLTDGTVNSLTRTINRRLGAQLL